MKDCSGGQAAQAPSTQSTVCLGPYLESSDGAIVNGSAKVPSKAEHTNDQYSRQCIYPDDQAKQLQKQDNPSIPVKVNDIDAYALAIQAAVSAVERAHAVNLTSLKSAHKSMLEDALAGKDAIIQHLTAENACLRRSLTIFSIQIKELTQMLQHHGYMNGVSAADSESELARSSPLPAMGKPIEVESCVSWEADNTKLSEKVRFVSRERFGRLREELSNTEAVEEPAISTDAPNPQRQCSSHRQRRSKKPSTSEPVNAAAAEAAVLSSRDL